MPFQSLPLETNPRRSLGESGPRTDTAFVGARRRAYQTGVRDIRKSEFARIRDEIIHEAERLVIGDAGRELPMQSFVEIYPTSCSDL